MVPSCSPGHVASIGAQRDLPRSNFEFYLSRSLCTYHVICHDLWWPQYWHAPKKVSYKSRGSFNELSNATSRLSLIRGLRDLTRGGGGKKAPPRPIPSLSEATRNRVKALSLGPIGCKRILRAWEPKLEHDFGFNSLRRCCTILNKSQKMSFYARKAANFHEFWTL